VPVCFDTSNTSSVSTLTPFDKVMVRRLSSTIGTLKCRHMNHQQARSESERSHARAESTQIFPPHRSTIFLQMARPIPVPSYAVWECRR
jgi:hypothetical protein